MQQLTSIRLWFGFPSQVAASEGRTDIVELLIRHGANVEHRDRWASTAYHEAERGGYHDILRLIRQVGSSGDSSRRSRMTCTTP